jgi:predicted membrane protein
LGLLIPGWIFTWPVVLIIIGFAIGVRNGFKSFGSLGLILIGLFFLARHEGWIPFGLGHYFWALIIIFIGIVIIINPRRSRMWAANWQGAGGYQNLSEDIISTVAIFYGIRKNVMSKKFKGGEIVNIFGGTEINLMQAEINGKASIEVVNVFGGVKLIVPSDWDVRINAIHIFAGADDKRSVSSVSQAKNTLIITGTAIFGGIEVRNF